MYVVVIAAPHMTGLMLRLAVKLVEAPVIGSFILGYLKNQNNMNEVNSNHRTLAFVSFTLYIDTLLTYITFYIDT